MNAYERIYAALVQGGMAPVVAALELAELRQETGAELSTSLCEHAEREYGVVEDERVRGFTGNDRRQKTRLGAWRLAATKITALTAIPRGHTIPGQRDNGSTT